MARTARIIIPGIAYHITQRGNGGNDVFYGDADCRAYLLSLAELSQEPGLRVWAYCLMGNHVHLIAVPETAEALAGTMRTSQGQHSRRLNARLDTTGHVWQSRYYSCALDDDHLWTAVRYVERNPVRAGLVERAVDYNWSSARPHAGLRRDPVLCDSFPLVSMVDDWAEWLMDVDDEVVVGRLRRCTTAGKPFGSTAFANRVLQSGK